MELGLTGDQRERIERNRERALELQRLKRKVVGGSSANGDENPSENKRFVIDPKGRCKNLDRTQLEETRNCMTNCKVDASASTDCLVDDSLEAFEEGASEYITKQEAMKMYCLPQGTLDVCSFIEKPNPKKMSWSSMKLYSRAEIRQRAHIRYGGVNGLSAEREKRSRSRFEKDLEKSKLVFR